MAGIATPTNAIPRLELSLSGSEFKAHEQREGYIGSSVLPVLPVKKDEGTYERLKLEDFLRPKEINRSPTGGYERSSLSFKDESYKTKEKGHEMPLGDRERKQVDDVLPMEMARRDTLTQALTMGREMEIAAAVMNTTTFSGNRFTDLNTTTTYWTDKANANPVKDVDDGRNKIRKYAGVDPNFLIIPRKAAEGMNQVSSMMDRVQYVDEAAAKRIMEKELTRIFKIDVLVAWGRYNNSDDGKDYLDIWPEQYAMLAKLHTNGSDRASIGLGRTLVWQEEGATSPGLTLDELALIFDEYREEQTRRGILRGRCDWQHKIEEPDCGHLLQIASLT